VLAFPKNFVLFGTIIAPAANVIWDNGILAGTQAAALERIDYLAPVYKRVKPIATTSPEYTGIVVGHYNRQVNGNGAVSGPFYLIKLLNGAGYMELLVSDTEEVS
jgi:hypothetical protein